LVYNGLFELIDGWTEGSAGRRVLKFKLRFAGTDGQHRPGASRFGRRPAYTKLGQAGGLEAGSGQVPGLWNDIRSSFRSHHSVFERWLIEESSEYPDIMRATQSG